ncbi:MULTISPECIES: hypothetical protein [Corynebacterium]|uniref:hypothetical protein n=1 Tax=Corynebacterium TaxID=1716 RepID=UPI0008AA4763|nr:MULTISPECIES: hypothetical protein [Corynebacterium]MDK8663502.1 hypothetical protein [Corynebacterium coyleae]MDK8707488.1 hypothetical protein [Corynebacterium coyleae]MDK8734336.1 hypothetical protein [Corynebacterium coyleae]MDK8893583.1 hypothetical protein [Corynebacterium coyleae]OHO27263.1 hypothetical protein HMPREF2656_03805 [Corynebacterium sp. HMSC034B08]
MKRRIVAASVAATTALSLAVVPTQFAHAQTSSIAYFNCVATLNDLDEKRAEAPTDDVDKFAKDFYESIVDNFVEELDVKGSSNEGTCMNVLLHPKNAYRPGTIAFLVLAPIAVLALLYTAAGKIPGVELPSLSSLPR